MIKIIYPVKESRQRDKKRRRFGLVIGKKLYRMTANEVLRLSNSIEKSYHKAVATSVELI